MKTLENIADIKSRLLKAEFYELECKKCLNTDLQKKRDCDLLYGYKKPCCNLMDLFVEKGNKGLNEELLRKKVDLLFELKTKQ